LDRYFPSRILSRARVLWLPLDCRMIESIRIIRYVKEEKSSWTTSHKQRIKRLYRIEGSAVSAKRGRRIGPPRRVRPNSITPPPGREYEVVLVGALEWISRGCSILRSFVEFISPPDQWNQWRLRMKLPRTGIGYEYRIQGIGENIIQEGINGLGRQTTNLNLGLVMPI